MEFLKIHPNGQWELLDKQQYKPVSTNTSGGMESPRISSDKTNDFRAYRSTTGQLREDHGTKGQLHGNPGNKRAPKQGLPVQHQGKPPTLLPSSAANTDPGLGV